MIKYIRINAVDSYEIGIRDMVIDVNNNQIVSGNIDVYNDFKVSETIPVKEYVDKHGSIWAKVIDNGRYELINENDTIVSSVQGYVPEWIDLKYNKNEGFGDYIDFEIDENYILKTNKDIPNVNELFENMISSITNLSANYSKEGTFDSIDKLNLLKNNLSDPYYTEKLDKGIEILTKHLKKWED